MKKLGAILFGIVFILGLSIVTAPAQEFETLIIKGVDFEGSWNPGPSPAILNDWDSNPDASSAGIDDDLYSFMRLNFEEPKPGSYTAIKVKLRVSSSSNYDNNVLTVRIYDGGTPIGDDWYLVLTENQNQDDYTEYPNEWLVNMTAAELADLQVEIEVNEYYYGFLQFSAVQVELTPEVAAPPEEPDPFHVNIDYRPYRSSNPLNYRSRGKVRVVIFGAADFDVRQIDRASVFLAGVVAPVRDHIRRVYSRTDRARDEHEDLVLMFKTQQLIKALEKSLGRELKNRDPVDLVLTGNLIKDDTATPFEGEAEATVFGKRHKRKNEENWKNYWKWWR